VAVTGFDQNDYEVDTANRRNPDAAIKDGAILYRVTSDMYSGKKHILTGAAPLGSLNQGRYNTYHQRTTYCANNVTVCLSEMLYRLYRGVLDGVQAGLAPHHLEQLITKSYNLVVFAVGKIDGLVYVDSDGAKLYNPKLTGTSVTSPDPTYAPLHQFGTNVRGAGKRGVVYPSARHSDDFAFALFYDETKKIKTDPYKVLDLRLQLISEGQDFKSKHPGPFDFTRDKMHPTIGYYEFADEDAFRDLKVQKLINPDDLAEWGYIDFVRRRYDIMCTYTNKKIVNC
jgi:hypothetical protein